MSINVDIEVGGSIFIVSKKLHRSRPMGDKRIKARYQGTMKSESQD